MPLPEGPHPNGANSIGKALAFKRIQTMLDDQHRHWVADIQIKGNAEETAFALARPTLVLSTIDIIGLKPCAEPLIVTFEGYAPLELGPFNLKHTYDAFCQQLSEKTERTFYLKSPYHQRCFALDLYTAAEEKPQGSGISPSEILRSLLYDMTAGSEAGDPTCTTGLEAHHDRLLGLFRVVTNWMGGMPQEVEEAREQSQFLREYQGCGWFWTPDGALVVTRESLLSAARKHELKILTDLDQLQRALRTLKFDCGNNYTIRVKGITNRPRYWISPEHFTL